MSSLTVKQVEQRLQSVRCAICKATEFTIDQRTAQEPGEWKGMCLKCRYTFPVHTDMEFYLGTQPDVPYWLRDIACPSCQNKGVNLDFRIVMSVRESIYLVTCKTCQHQFAERSSLEAFE